MSKPIVIYHSNCADGFSSAWVIWSKYKDTYEYYPGIYSQPPPDIKDRDVYLVDFSYKLNVIEDMLNAANSVTILDHHKTAIDDLDHLIANNSLKGVFDLDRSGAMITWDYFNPGVEPPQLLKHIQDRDLWKFQLSNTREIQANVFSYPYEFEVWDDLMKKDINSLIIDGIAIERKHLKDIDELIKINSHPAIIKGIFVKCCNLPYTFTADASMKLAKNMPFGFCYTYTSKGVTLSFRSDENGLDVSEIAKSFGGGGHVRASSCVVPYDRVKWQNNTMIVD
jgi:oligoribonuclease NrnB/cAMP/cGMP phosphodiesterase (DHH superfamily)